MKNAAALFILFVLSVGTSAAQTDAQYTASLKKMLALAGTEESFQVAIKQMIGMFKEEKSEVPDSVWIAFEEEFSKTSMDELVTMLVPVYQKHLTESDLQGMIEFYQTPVGKKYAQKTPLIMQESMQVGQQWGMKIGAAFDEKLRAKGY